MKADTGETVALIVEHRGATVVRIGYDVLAEVDALLSHGQPPAHASSPSLELHIEALRAALLEAGLPVVEIAPHPLGHPYMVCLTHDIDFIGIRHHRFDHTLLGFVYRVFRSVGRRPWAWDTVRKNFAALLSVPAVHLGMAEDFWYPMRRYTAVEKDRASTYFFIPFAGRPGQLANSPRGRYRAAPYDVNEYSEDLRRLEAEGREVAVHGIDAWCDANAGTDEADVIRQITGSARLGIRMHWLYFSEASVSQLEKAGYVYDSTLGYNDAVGFRNGTTQVFRPPGAVTLLELPLNIQDTALFFPDRMNLSDAAALTLCRTLMTTLERFGGVLTTNWHDRSLAPERNWNALYDAIVSELVARNACFVQARQAVRWFQQRRSTEFASVHASDTTVTVRLTTSDAGIQADGLPALCLRVLVPGSPPATDNASLRGPARTIERPIAHDDQAITVNIAD